MPYLVCKKCREYYRIEDWETPDEYSDRCECGGKLYFYDYIPLNKVYRCLRCGFKGRMGSSDTGWLFCPQCQYKYFLKDKCPICGFKDKLLEQKYPNLFGTAYKCPNCGNKFGILYKKSKSNLDYSFLIRNVGQLIIMLVLALLIIFNVRV